MFSGSFRRPFQSPIAAGDAAAAVVWYLSGGIALANCIAAYRAKGAASYAASKSNLANPGTYDAGDGTAYPTWAGATGWAFNGSTQYLTTGVIPGANWTFAVQYTGATADGILFGVQDGATTKRIYLLPSYGTNVILQYGSNQMTPAELTAGNLIVQRTVADSKIHVFQNGAEVGTPVATAWVDPAIAIWLGGGNNAGSLSLPQACTMIAWAAYNTVLTGPQITALAAAMAAL